MRNMAASNKAELRQRVRELIRGISSGERGAAATACVTRLREEALWHNARTVMLFTPMPDEPDIAPCLDEAWAARKLVAFPRFNPASRDYTAAIAVSRAELVRGRFGVLEPGAGCPVVPLNQLDLVLVPGVAFDLLGGRLGRGKGFYDRLLAQVRGHKCGVAYDVQIVPSVPVEPHDIRVDSILTPSRWHLCRPA